MNLSLFFTFCSCIFFIIFSTTFVATLTKDILHVTEEIYDGEKLVSSNQRFELGFFSPVNSSNRYLGIWYRNLPQTVIWVANRSHHLTGQHSSLQLHPDGQILLCNATTGVRINYDLNSTTTTPVLQLLNDGNLVLKYGDDSEGFIWQSFSRPTDTLLPDMLLGLSRNLTSWKSGDDPSIGNFTLSLDSSESPQLVLRRGSEKVYRWGPWDGGRFIGSSDDLKASPIFSPVLVYNDQEVYYKFRLTDESIHSRVVVTQEGKIQFLKWNNQSNEWVNLVTLQNDDCDRYNFCGAYGNCYSDAPICRCLAGFVPKSSADWARGDWSGGCTRKWQLSCNNGEGFMKYSGLKLPDNFYIWGNDSLGLEQCEAECLRNCSCTAYTKIDVLGTGTQCVFWFGDLVDMRYLPKGGRKIYIRMPAAELETMADDRRIEQLVKCTVIVITTTAAMLSCGVICRCISGIWWPVKKARSKFIHGDLGKEDLELPLFDLVTIATATNNFSSGNKIGEGGFGSVYKGTLSTGKEIAVKRLSKHSGQGLDELKNEIILISKLQHRNLVKLLGCCIHGEERMLIYEYMPNKSLDNFIFDQARKTVLDWPKRFNIITGIARGLLYIHQDSRLRIIHRDLKASNILLDHDMNPKISDFGLARIFRADQTEAATTRVVGTYGYMSPEYAMTGIFSEKSDVFSYGVLVLEIISGHRNRTFSHPDHDLNLLGHAWRLWNEGKPLELMDANIKDSVAEDELERCIQLALLCVLEHPRDRPTMSSVLFMLGSDAATLPEPKEPAFCSESSSMGFPTDMLPTGQHLCSPNGVTVSVLLGR